MMNKKRRITLTIFCFATALFTAYLGLWQLERKAWKETLINTYLDNQEQEMMLLNITPNQHIIMAQCENKACEDFSKTQIFYDPEKHFMHPVGTLGRIEFDKTVFVVGKWHNGEAGYHLISPVVIYDGGRILVNRGWIPESERSNALIRPSLVRHPEININGVVDSFYGVEGLIRPSDEPPRIYMPQHIPEKREFVNYDLEAIKTYLESQNPEEKIHPILIEQTVALNSNKYPILLKGNVSFLNDHFKYALTWFSLSLVSILMWIIFMFRTRKES